MGIRMRVIRKVSRQRNLREIQAYLILEKKTPKRISLIITQMVKKVTNKATKIRMSSSNSRWKILSQ